MLHTKRCRCPKYGPKISAPDHCAADCLRDARPNPRSVRPYQLLQFQQVAGLPLPVRDAELPDRIAEAMQEYQRHQPALQLEIQIRARKTESLKKAAHTTRY